VVVYEGELSRDEDDDTSDAHFTASFRPIPELVVLPHFRPNRYVPSHPVFAYNNFPWNVGAEPLDYPKLFKAELAKVWPEFGTDDYTECVVGYVDGVEITRRVSRYLRK
jgi:hypothetical protein